MTGPRTFIVGDVHGCFGELTALLHKAGLGADDRLAFVGDLVARGPDSAAVVAFARERRALGVLGNHDDALLKHRQGHPLKKAQAAVAEQLSQADWRYLEGLPLTLSLGEALVVHAGLVPGVALAAQPRHLLLNLRSLDARGQPSTRVEDGVPWASRWPGPRRVIFGHDALRRLQRHPFALGLDTGCVYGGALTGLWLEEDRLVSVDARRAWFPLGG